MGGRSARGELPRLQRWMQRVVVDPAPVDEALQSPAARRELPGQRVEEVVLPSRHLSPGERVGIYHGMYLLRMHDALATDYAALQHLIGEQRFFALVRDYVQAYPSRSFSLNRLGDRLPEFIARRTRLPRRALCHDLARLELAVTHVFDAPASPSLGVEEIQAVPEAAWPDARLEPVAAFRLLALRYPVNAYLQSVIDDDHDHPPLRARRSYVAVFRAGFAMRRLDLVEPAYELLSDLAGGARFGAALARAARRRGRRAVAEEQLYGWFRDWVSGGIFQAIRLP